MHGRHSDRMRINDLLHVRAHTMEYDPNAASEIEVRWDYPDRGPCGAGVAMPRQR
jgi:hypothetical protein